MSISLQARFWRIILRTVIKGQRLSLPQKRDQQTQNAKFLNRPAAGIAIAPALVEGIPAAWIQPENAPPNKVILYLHGGGYVLGGLQSHQMLCSALAKHSGFNLLLPEYRLAPEHPFPAALQDANQTYAWLLQQGYKPENILLAGDSAGGGLAVATALHLRESGTPLPAALVCLSPWLDLTLSGQSHQTQENAEVLLRTEDLQTWASLYAVHHNPAHPLLSPLHADLRGLPPLLIQVGSDEILLDDSRRFAQKAMEQGVTTTLHIWQGMWHVWHTLGDFMPESRQALDGIAQFARQACGE
jgi:acetyl esterase/lipase